MDREVNNRNTTCLQAMVSLAQMRNQRVLSRVGVLLLMVNLLTWLGACLPSGGSSEIATPTVAATAVPQRTPATVEAIEILQVDTFPVEVSVIASGHFPDECTNIDQIRQDRRGGTFVVAIDSVQYGGSVCPENRIPFEESIELDLIGLPAGIYVVDVNGLQGTFKLQRDNIPDEGNAVVGGQVWHDRCELIAQDEGERIEPAAACVEFDEGSYRGNGKREPDESGLGGVIVQLGAGICPSTGLATTLTDADGAFLFSGLTAGDYCLSVANEDGLNSALSTEGEWTFPAEDNGQRTLSLVPGDSKLRLDFGWSMVQREQQREEQPELFAPPDAECTNKALFIADLSVPDDTVMSAAETFTKTWRLQNLGSCTWDSAYRLVPAADDELGAPASVPLTETIPPGEFGNLSVILVAPEVNGTYRGEWRLLSPEGVLFGIGPGSDRPFWVQIMVVEEEAAG